MAFDIGSIIKFCFIDILDSLLSKGLIARIVEITSGFSFGPLNLFYFLHCRTHFFNMLIKMMPSINFVKTAHLCQNRIVNYAFPYLPCLVKKLFQGKKGHCRNIIFFIFVVRFLHMSEKISSKLIAFHGKGYVWNLPHNFKIIDIIIRSV